MQRKRMKSSKTTTTTFSGLTASAVARRKRCRVQTVLKAIRLGRIEARRVDLPGGSYAWECDPASAAKWRLGTPGRPIGSKDTKPRKPRKAREKS